MSVVSRILRPKIESLLRGKCDKRDQLASEIRFLAGAAEDEAMLGTLSSVVIELGVIGALRLVRCELVRLLALRAGRAYSAQASPRRSVRPLTGMTGSKQGGIPRP